jgi:uncharacterized membrane protein
MAQPHDASTSSDADTIVGISFDDSFRAQEFLTATYGLVAKHSVELRDAVMIAKTLDGKTHVRETVDPQPATSALSGGLWASLFGLILAGPVGWLAGAVVGAGAGALRAKLVDLGLPDEWVAWFREAVQPGTVTVVLLLGRLDRTLVLDELERFSGAHLVYANVTPDLVQRIRDALDDPSTGPLTAEEPPPSADGADDGGGLPPPDPESRVG